MTSGKDLVPARNADFDVWATRLHDYAVANLSGWTTSAILDEWEKLQTAWTKAWNKVKTGDARKSETQAKNDARKALEAFLRHQVKVLFNVAIQDDNELRVSLGLPVYTGERHSRMIGNQTPAIEGEISGRNHKIYFFRPDDMNKRGIISDADGVEIYMHHGGAFTDDINEYNFVTAIRKSPYVHTFQPEDMGKKIHWVARWYNSKGEKGPWSNFITLVVGNE